MLVRRTDAVPVQVTDVVRAEVLDASKDGVVQLGTASHRDGIHLIEVGRDGSHATRERRVPIWNDVRGRWRRRGGRQWWKWRWRRGSGRWGRNRSRGMRPGARVPVADRRAGECAAADVGVEPAADGSARARSEPEAPLAFRGMGSVGGSAGREAGPKRTVAAARYQPRARRSIVRGVGQRCVVPACRSWWQWRAHHR